VAGAADGCRPGSDEVAAFDVQRPTAPKKREPGA